MRYVKSHPAAFFVNEYEKFAKLGVLEVSDSAPRSDPGAVSLGGNKRLWRQSDPNVPSLEPAHKRSGATGSGEDQPSPLRYRLGSTEIFQGSGLSASARARSASVGYNAGMPPTGNVVPVSKVLADNREIAQALEKACLDVSAYCQHVMTFVTMAKLQGMGVEAANYGEFLRQTGLALQCLMRNIAETQNRSSTALTCIIMQQQMERLQAISRVVPSITAGQAFQK